MSLRLENTFCGVRMSVKLLEFLYVNSCSALAVGAAQYGLMCTDDGVVLDDGITARIANDEYYMTTTSSGAAAIGEWMQSCFPGLERMLVTITPVTHGYAAMNVAGPKSRDLLGSLIQQVDLDPSSFPYMAACKARVAGIDNCYIMRLGFTGELSYEIHVPAAYGSYLWELIMECGRRLGIKAFGVEAQRIMRLEKGNVIIGQDND